MQRHLIEPETIAEGFLSTTVTSKKGTSVVRRILLSFGLLIFIACECPAEDREVKPRGKPGVLKLDKSWRTGEHGPLQGFNVPPGFGGAQSGTYKVIDIQENGHEKPTLILLGYILVGGERTNFSNAIDVVAGVSRPALTGIKGGKVICRVIELSNYHEVDKYQVGDQWKPYFSDRFLVVGRQKRRQVEVDERTKKVQVFELKYTHEEGPRSIPL